VSDGAARRTGRLLLLRHAPTAWNEAGRLQGRSDQPLSPAGQALAASWRLPAFAAGWPVLSSPLLRARQTAEAMGLLPRPEPTLIEMDWGRWEGRTLAEIAAAEGPALAANEALGLDFQPPGGESPRAVMARLAPWLRGVARQELVAVAHKGVLRALLALATGWDFRGQPPARPGSGQALLFALDAAGRPSLRPPPLDLAPGRAP
jgi:broad specificity phosphatase PhoE